MDADFSLFQTLEKLGIALGLGLLVGMQRQRVDSGPAGIRTFTLITLLGAITGLVSLKAGLWFPTAGLLALGAIILAYLSGPGKAEESAGLTTEAAMLVMFSIGVYVIYGHSAAAAVLAGTIALLLHLKPEMHSFVKRMGDKDFRAIMQFVLISLVILPSLPNRAYGPYEVLNPFKIWLLVVLIVAISLSGYVIYKFLGPRSGSILSGILGGVISSTATTVSYSRRAKASSEAAPMASMVIVIASTVVFLRVILIAAVAVPSHIAALAGPLAAMFVVFLLISCASWFFTRRGKDTMPEQENPTELKAAVSFAVLFGAVLLATAAAKHYLGSSGLYFVAAVSGLTDVDAITLSSAGMLGKGNLSAAVAWRMIIIASLSNLAFKAGVTAAAGGRTLFLRTTAFFAPAFAAGFLILWLWP